MNEPVGIRGEETEPTVISGHRYDTVKSHLPKLVGKCHIDYQVITRTSAPGGDTT